MNMSVWLKWKDESVERRSTVWLEESWGITEALAVIRGEREYPGGTIKSRNNEMPEGWGYCPNIQDHYRSFVRGLLWSRLWSLPSISHGKEPGFLIEITDSRTGQESGHLILPEKASGIIVKNDKRQLKLPSTGQRWDNLSIKMIMTIINWNTWNRLKKKNKH